MDKMVSHSMMITTSQVGRKLAGGEGDVILHPLTFSATSSVEHSVKTLHKTLVEPHILQRCFSLRQDSYFTVHTLSTEIHIRIAYIEDLKVREFDPRNVEKFESMLKESVKSFGKVGIRMST